MADCNFNHDQLGEASKIVGRLYKEIDYKNDQLREASKIVGRLYNEIDYNNRQLFQKECEMVEKDRLIESYDQENERIKLENEKLKHDFEVQRREFEQQIKELEHEHHSDLEKKNEKLLQMECKVEEKNMLIKAYIEEHEKLKHDFELQKKEFEQRIKELEHERHNSDMEKKNEELMQMEHKVEEKHRLIKACIEAMVEGDMLIKACIEGMVEGESIKQEHEKLKHDFELQKKEFEQQVKELEHEHHSDLEKKNEKLLQMEHMVEGKDMIIKAYIEEIRKIQLSARELFQKIFNEHEKIKLQLETENREIEMRGKEFEEREAQNENDRKKLSEEIEKIKLQLETGKRELEMRGKELEEREAQNENDRKRLSEEIEKIKLQFETGKRELEMRGKELEEREAQNENDRKRLSEEIEKIKLLFETGKRELEMRGKELEQREAQIENDRKKLSEEIEKNAMQNSLLQLATIKQERANENVLKLAEDPKRLKEDLYKRIIQLEKQLDAKQALELEIEQLRGTLNGMKHMGDDGDLEVLKKVKEMNKNFREKEGDLDDLEALNQTLIVKERKNNDELQEAQKELIDGLKEVPKNSHIGVKRMGELDKKPFHEASKRKYNEVEAEERALELCSLWEVYISQETETWQPHSKFEYEVKYKEVIDDKDEKLKCLKNEFGDKSVQVCTSQQL